MAGLRRSTHQLTRQHRTTRQPRPHSPAETTTPGARASFSYDSDVGTLRVVVIDDDHWKRTAMAQELDADPRIGVVGIIDQDEAILWPRERWNDVDVAIVDVFDENAPSEIGTDVFSGISALDRLRDLPVRTFAITPHCQHPLIQLRIHQAQADWLYHRWEVNDPDRLVSALLDPRPDHVPQRPKDSVLRQYGSQRAHTNRAITLYQRSALSGLLRPRIGIKSLHLPRSKIERLRVEVARSGFDGTEELSTANRIHRAPRWPDVRDYLLTLLGRQSTPSTETDRDDGAIPHPYSNEPPDTPDDPA